MSTDNMFALFDCSPRLKLFSSEVDLRPRTVDVLKCVFQENVARLLFAINARNTIVCCAVNKSLPNDQNGKDICAVKNFAVHESKGELKDLCFDATGDSLLLLFEDRSLIKVPVEDVMKSDQLINKDALSLITCPLVSPVCIEWWTTLDGQQDIAIIGNSFGEITFINIQTNKEIGGTYVPFCVKSISVIRDKYSVSLLISCKNESQWRLTLEETRRKAHRRNSVTNTDETEENKQSQTHYFGCFITNIEDNESQSFECWNLKPKLIATKKARDNTNEESYLLYQFPFLIQVMSISPESKDVCLRVYSCQEFDYEFSTPMSSYVIPKNYIDFTTKIVVITERIILCVKGNCCSLLSKEFCDFKIQKGKSVIQQFRLEDEEILSCFRLMKLDDDNLLDSFLIVTNRGVHSIHPKTRCETFFVNLMTSNFESNCFEAERFALMLRLNVNLLYEKAADVCLKKKQFAQSVRFYQLSKAPQLKRIANFISYGYFAEVIAYIQVLFSSKSHEIIEVDKIHFANIAVNCFVQEIISKRRNDECQSIVKALTLFLIENQHYDEQVVIRLLLQYSLYELAEVCAQARGQYSTFFSHFLNLNELFPKLMDSGLCELIESSDFKDVIEERTNCPSYFKSLSSPNLIQAVLTKPHLLGKALKQLINSLPNLTYELLVPIASNFDPRKAKVQILLNRVLPQLRQEYLEDDQSDEIVTKTDVLNFFIFVLLMVLRYKELNKRFDRRLINFGNRKSNRKQRTKLPKKEFEVSAGYCHSSAIIDGTAYMWGKPHFGNLAFSDFNSSETESVIHPVPLTVFSKTMSVAVSLVCCGAHHTLVLTDCGCFAFGSSKYGQLGVGKDLKQTSVPMLIEMLVNESIVTLSCGQYHSLAVSWRGTLFTWGWGIHGQLGHGNPENFYIPTIVKSLLSKKIIAACGGYSHSVVLDSNGIVYTFGNGSFGQLGSGSNVKRSLPQPVTLLKKSIKMISSHYFHTLALASDSQTLFIWGSNPQTVRLQAQISRKTRSQQCNESISFTDHLYPQIVIMNSIKCDVLKISAGNTHSLLLTVDGKVYSWGRGSDGQLGHGACKELKEPTLIPMANKIRDIAAGHDFTLAVDVNGGFFGWGQNSHSQLGTQSFSPHFRSSFDKQKNRRITIRTNRRLITLTPGEKPIEVQPVKITFPPNPDDYCDSFSVDNKSIICHDLLNTVSKTDSLTNEQVLNYDQVILASILFSNKQYLDFKSVATRCLTFENYQGAAIASEILEEFDNSMQYNLKALQYSANTSADVFVDNLKLIIEFHVSKTMNSVINGKKVLTKLYSFWKTMNRNTDELEQIIVECYEQKIQNFVFGVLFFHFMEEFEKEFNFSKSFKLTLASITLKYLKEGDLRCFTSEPVMNLMTVNCQLLDFPTEKLWKNIVKNIGEMGANNVNSGVEFTATDNEMVVFSCSHCFAGNVLNEKLSTNDCDPNSTVREQMCPKCLIR